MEYRLITTGPPGLRGARLLPRLLLGEVCACFSDLLPVNTAFSKEVEYSASGL